MRAFFKAKSVIAGVKNALPPPEAGPAVLPPLEELVPDLGQEPGLLVRQVEDVAHQGALDAQHVLALLGLHQVDRHLGHGVVGLALQLHLALAGFAYKVKHIFQAIHIKKEQKAKRCQTLLLQFH